MKYTDLIKKTNEFPVFNSELLLAGREDIRAIKVQVSRWQKMGKIIQIKRGLYALPEMYRRHEINEYVLAAFLHKPSYVSCEKALEYASIIPDVVQVCTCLTTKRPQRYHTPLGTFDYRHIKTNLFWGYNTTETKQGVMHVACPEKALLDLIYVHGMRITKGWLHELRLQNQEVINTNVLKEYAEQFKKPGMKKAVKLLIQVLTEDVGKGQGV